MTDLRLQTLGGFSLTLNGEDVPKFEKQPVRAALLLYLAIERETRRDQLVDLLWPEFDEKGGRHNLNQTLYGLRQMLGEAWVEREGDVIRVHDEVAVDLLELDEAIEAEDWKRGLELYQGPFLHGTSLSSSRTFQEWAESRRTQAVRRAREAWRLAFQSPLILSDPGAGVELARAWVEHDPLEDEAQHTLLEQLARAGRRAEALEAYEKYEVVLREELELEPLDHTKALVDMIRDGKTVAVQADADVAPSATPTASGIDRTAAAPQRPPAGAPTRAPASFLLPVGVVAILLLLVYRVATSPPEPAPLRTFDLLPPRQLTATQAYTDAALSPDGSMALLIGTDSAGRTQLWSRSITTSQVSPVPGSEGAHTPFWAPEGDRLGYFAGLRLWISSLGGNRPQAVAEVTYESRGASWGSRDVVLYAPNDRRGLQAFDLAEGSVTQVTSPDRERGEIGHLWPSFLPNGTDFVFYVSSNVDSIRGVYLGSLQEPDVRRVAHGSGSVLFAEGHLLFYRNTEVYAQPFDPRALRATGREEILAPNVAAAFTYQAAFSASHRGSVLIYSPDSTRTHSRIAVLDRDGRSMGVEGPPKHQRNPALSPGGRYLAVEEYSGTDSDIVVTDRTSGGALRVDDDGAQARFPVWHPSGDRLLFAAQGAQGWELREWRRASTSPPRTLGIFEKEIIPTDWGAAGLIYHYTRDDGAFEIHIWPEPGSGEPSVLLTGRGNRLQPVFSPSDDRVAYASNDLGDYQIFIEPIPQDGSRCQVSTTTGIEPVWGSDERLYYIDLEGNLRSTSVQPGSRCVDIEPVTLAEGVVETPLVARNHFAFDPIAQTFVVNDYERPSAHTLSVLINWQRAIPSASN